MFTSSIFTPLSQLFKSKKFLGHEEKLGEELSNSEHNPDEMLVAAPPKMGGLIQALMS